MTEREAWVAQAEAAWAEVRVAEAARADAWTVLEAARADVWATRARARAVRVNPTPEEAR